MFRRFYLRRHTSRSSLFDGRLRILVAICLAGVFSRSPPSLSSEAIHDAGTWIDHPPRIRSECPAIADGARLDRGTLVAPAPRERRHGPSLTPGSRSFNAISRDVHDHRKKDVEFQQALERLYERVDLKLC